MYLKVFRAEMALRCEQHLDVLRSGIEYWRKLRGRHDYGLDITEAGYRTGLAERKIWLSSLRGGGFGVCGIWCVRTRVSLFGKIDLSRLVQYILQRCNSTYPRINDMAEDEIVIY